MAWALKFLDIGNHHPNQKAERAAKVGRTDKAVFLSVEQSCCGAQKAVYITEALSLQARAVSLAGWTSSSHHHISSGSLNADRNNNFLGRESQSQW